MSEDPKTRPAGTGDRPIVVATDGGGDDRVRPFALARVPVRGRVVRLGPVIDGILALHDYPEAIADELARLVALAALLGSMLKTAGRVTVQARGEPGAPLRFMVADCRTSGTPGAPADLRACASFDASAAGAAIEEGDLAAWCGARGDLAITLETGPQGRRWQGVVPLVDGDLARAAEHHFAQSEQIPTRLVLAAGRRAMPEGRRAGGLLIQHMPAGAGAADAGATDEDADGWRRVGMLFETLRTDELLDPALGDDGLLLRLFHEEGVRVFDPVPLRHRCGCSYEKVRAVVARFSPAERAAMATEDGAIAVRCQYCGRTYRIDPDRCAPCPEPRPESS